MTSDDASQRRSYWAAQMDEAYAFMQRIGQYPVCECAEPVASLREAVAGSDVEVVFSDTLIAGAFPRLFLLREGLIPAFLEAARDLNRRGWLLKVEDGYRTTEMQRHLSLTPAVLDRILAKVLWEFDGRLPAAEVIFRRLSALTATTPKTGTHMSASAMDISVLRLDDRGEVDRGAPYLEMSELTPMGSPFVSAEGTRHRGLITLAMGQHGFLPYPYEFWHYNQGDAYDEMLTGSGKPGRYGAVDVDLATGRVSPTAAPLASLHTPEAFEKALDEALQRRQAARE